MKQVLGFLVVFVVVFLGVAFLLKEKATAPQNVVVEQKTQETSTTTEKVLEVKKDEPIKNIMEKITRATLQTNKGEIEIEFFNDITPKTVENFTKLAGTGFYDGVKFHRVIPGFMIQGGDPLTKDDSLMARWGTGGPGYSFEDEITALNKNSAGTISMANSGPNTNGSQFFINTKDNNFLDGKHTVFGRVVKGADVVMSIEQTKTDERDRPLEAVVIKSIFLK